MAYNSFKCFRNVTLVLSGILLATELVLRFAFGFCNALLYQESDRYEYIAQPCQHRYRFFSHIDYNSYSQRSDEPDTAKTIILGLGDSVIFGGTWMDQDSLATTLLSKETGMQMLNISCGSWGPDNCAAYLKEKGTFGAKAIVLVCSSHDAYDVMSFVPVVGKYPSYPDKQYKLALWELAGRYLLPRIKNNITKNKRVLDPDAQVVYKSSNMQVTKKSSCFNPGFDELKGISDSLDIPFVIYLHAETGELQDERYNEMGQEIIRWAKNNDVYLMRGIKTEKSYMYHDTIHLNENGQRHLADCLEKILRHLGIFNEEKKNCNTPTGDSTLPYRVL